ncbi:MAG: hypothetical protein H6719_31105 [Sandaracinaceae bacterium]|nr:hypothetical protein [Sandaracinaceae bacterium]
MAFTCCSGCDRHVRIGDAVCPFCGEQVGEAPPSRVPSGRLGRAFQAALGAGLTVSVAGCPVYGGPDVEYDAAGPSSVDAAVARDAGSSDAGGGGSDAAVDDAGEADAGDTDAGDTDAGETDAGDTDAGDTDAG